MKTQRMYFSLPFVSLLITIFCSSMQSDHDKSAQEAWVDQTFQSLSEEQRIGQLFLVAAYSNKDERYYKAIEKLIQQYNIGGLIFFQGTATKQVQLTNRYQQAATTPLLMATDAEWGLGMRLRNTISYPRQMTLGALQDDTLIYKMGAEIARQLKLLGVHINFAPVMDVNSNPDNPVIGRRSFGENREKVAAKGGAYLRGLQDHGIFAVAKHFPGHGDTNQDSHHALPIIAHHRQRIEEIELFPFRKTIQEGIGGIMTAHLHVPAYDATPHRPATLSKKIVTGLLKKQLGFQGLVFTDALNMKGVSAQQPPGEAALLALQAGNDVLVFPKDVPKAIACIRKALKNKQLDNREVAEKVKCILRLKYQMGLHEWQPIATQHLDKKLHTPQAHLLKQQLFEKAVTVVSNKDHLVPIKHLAQLDIACLSIVSEVTANKTKAIATAAISDEVVPQESTASVFSTILKKYAPIAQHTLTREAITPTVAATLADKLKKYSVVIVGIHDMNGRRSKHFGLRKEELQLLQSLEQDTQVILVPFGSVYSLTCFSDFKHVIMPYEDDPVAAWVVPQIIFGALSAEGKLPVSISEAWQTGQGIRTESLARLNYTSPEAANMDSQILCSIDGIVEQAIADKVMPGCQVLVARKGKVVFEKGYGYHTYAKNQPVTVDTIYDVASLTKVAGTLQAMMYLVGEKKLDLKKKLGFYLPALKGTNKSSLKIYRILSHKAGLKPYVLGDIKKTLLDDDNQLRKALFRPQPSPSYQHQLASDLYGANWLKELVWDCCVNSELRGKRWFKSYNRRYSCVGFYLLHHLAEKLLGQPLDSFLEEEFYRPLGLTTLGYHPLFKFPPTRIAPTEEDNFFRQDLIWGIVHDPMAALYGGAAGNAGIFCNANDLAVLLQMNLQKGYYGDKRYLEQSVVKKFTQKGSKKHPHGLGWETPAASYVSAHASASAYGHTGFTGAVAWIDPKYDLVYIFLSNRICPDTSPNRLNKQKIRASIHDVVYQAMKDRNQE